MAVKPFTKLAERLNETLVEHATGVGAVTIVWAHLELSLDLLIGLEGHFSKRGGVERHPISFGSKMKRLEKALLASRPHLLPYEGELMQVITLSSTAAKRRNMVIHGAIVPDFSKSEIELMRAIRIDGEDDFARDKTSALDLFVTCQVIFEVTAHTYNLIFQLVRRNLPEYAHLVPDDQIDVSGFEFPAINPNYEPRQSASKPSE